jgi:chemotaxis protein methyltransferase CheR
VSLASDASELGRLRLALSELIGFAFEGDRLEQLEHTARARAAELSLPGLDAYVERLRVPEFQRLELTRLAEALTVTETFFYRNADQIRALVETVLPERVRRGGQRLRILCAGCASGEEPYSLAIALRESVPELESWNVQILGVDVNRALLAKAASARYTPWSLRATPDAIRARYFERSGSEFVLDPSVAKMVTFRAQNLAERDPLFFRALACDVIFCRNVLMYFTPEVTTRVVQHLTEALLPGGYLFLGQSETLRGLSHDYHLLHTHNAFYYQRREPTTLPPPRSSSRPPPAPELFALPDALEASGSWFDAIQRASNRVTEITTGEARPNAAPGTPARVPASASEAQTDLGAVLELVQRERFAEARGLLERLPAEASKHPDALLFSAVLLTNAGALADAERVSGALLAADELNAGAHYVKALCREHAGDVPGAIEHDTIAVHLDPSFAMPHLHAGLVARRTGDGALARRELSEALVLLEREDPSRLVLFGGGFSRAALTMLCRAELSKLEGIG